MRLAIPHPPRKVKLRQVPGALRRLGVSLGLGVVLATGLSQLGTMGARYWVTEHAFYESAQEVLGKVAAVKLPAKEEREGATATLHVLYAFLGQEHSASNVVTHAAYAEGLGVGAEVTLLVSPTNPTAPREARYAREKAWALWLAPAGLGLGVVLALLGLGWELRRTLRADLEPLRKGMLVWLTPAEPLSPTRSETVFAASYYQGDVKHEVRARARPGRAPVKNGPKLLAAVVPFRPTWVRVIDEDLAKTLGWVE
ncbi:MAG: DUF3592 domain-containing protein [Myxococcota bacterium]